MAATTGDPPEPLPFDRAGATTPTTSGPPGSSGELRLVVDGRPDPALPRELADELSCVATWLEAHAHRVSLLSAERGLASPLPRLPSFDPRTPADTARRARR